jgi:mono/diheme cytochrome c family protein
MAHVLGHAAVALVLAATPGWHAGIVTPPAPSASSERSASAERGRLLIERRHCGACHRIPGVAHAVGTLAPSLAQFGRRSYIAGTLPNDAPTLARWIVEPRSLRPDAAMPTLGVSEAEARAMAAYLLGLT